MATILSDIARVAPGASRSCAPSGFCLLTARVHEPLLRGYLRDFERYHANCRFPDCTHDHEPDCAVFDAVDREELPASRYASYVEMLDELDEGQPFDPDAEPDEPPPAPTAAS